MASMIQYGLDPMAQNQAGAVTGGVIDGNNAPLGFPLQSAQPHQDALQLPNYKPLSQSQLLASGYDSANVDLAQVVSPVQSNSSICSDTNPILSAQFDGDQQQQISAGSLSMAKPPMKQPGSGPMYNNNNNLQLNLVQPSLQSASQPFGLQGHQGMNNVSNGISIFGVGSPRNTTEQASPRASVTGPAHRSTDTINRFQTSSTQQPHLVAHGGQGMALHPAGGSLGNMQMPNQINLNMNFDRPQMSTNGLPAPDSQDASSLEHPVVTGDKDMLDCDGTLLSKHQVLAIYALRSHLTCGGGTMEKAAAGRSAVVAQLFECPAKVVRDIWTRKIADEVTKTAWTGHEQLLHDCTSYKRSHGLPIDDHLKPGPAPQSAGGKAARSRRNSDGSLKSLSKTNSRRSSMTDLKEAINEESKPYSRPNSKPTSRRGSVQDASAAFDDKAAEKWRKIHAAAQIAPPPPLQDIPEPVPQINAADQNGIQSSDLQTELLRGVASKLQYLAPTKPVL